MCLKGKYDYLILNLSCAFPPFGLVYVGCHEIKKAFNNIPKGGKIPIVEKIKKISKDFKEKFPKKKKVVHKTQYPIGDLKYFDSLKKVFVFQSEEENLTPLSPEWKDESGKLQEILDFNFSPTGISIEKNYTSVVELPFKRFAGIYDNKKLEIFKINEKEKRIIVEQSIEILENEQKTLRLFSLADGKLICYYENVAKVLDFSIEYDGALIKIRKTFSLSSQEQENEKGGSIKKDEDVLNYDEADPEKVKLTYGISSVIETDHQTVKKVIDLPDVGKFIFLTFSNDLYVYNREDYKIIKIVKFKEEFNTVPTKEDHRINDIKYLGGGNFIMAGDNGWMSFANSETWDKYFPILNNRCIYKIKIFQKKIYTLELDCGKDLFGKEKLHPNVLQWGINQGGEFNFEASLVNGDYDKILYCFEGLCCGRAITCEHLGKEIYYWENC